MTDPFARLGASMVRWRWVVLGVWLVVLVVVGGLLAPKAPKALKGGGFIDPDSESAKAAAILDTEFNASTFTSAVAVFRSNSGTVDDSTFKDQVTRAADSLASVHGVRSVQTFYSTENPLLVSADRHTTFALVPLEGNEGDIQELVPDLRASIKNIPLEHYLTGTPAVNSDLQSTSEEDLQRSENFTVPIVVILLLLVFRTAVAAVLPLLIGACSIVLALGGMYLVSTQTEVSIFALNVTTMIGLGLGIDFSLILANRFREELANGRRVEDAVTISMATAGPVDHLLGADRLAGDVRADPAVQPAGRAVHQPRGHARGVYRAARRRDAAARAPGHPRASHRVGARGAAGTQASPTSPPMRASGIA